MIFKFAGRVLLHERVERYSAANFRMLRPFIISTPALPVHVCQLANAHSRTVVLVHTLVALLLHSCSNIECRIVGGTKRIGGTIWLARVTKFEIEIVFALQR